MGVPVVTGWAAGDIAAGLMATIGAFTALYGDGRPYLNRAIHLGAIAISFALSVTLGVWAAEIPLLVVPAIVVIAMLATFLCNALRVGPPGAYMFALACAAGTAIPTAHLSLTQVGLLVFAGGAFAWLAHMAGVLVSSRGPERAAVAGAARAVARFVEAIGTPGEDGARHTAALAMYDSWTVLVTQQPAQPRPSGTLSRLRALGRELNLLFANAMNTSRLGGPALAGIAAKARQLAAEAADTADRAERTDPNHVPLGHHGVLRSVREGLRPWAPPLLVAARVGVATAIAGAIGATLGLERAYWTMAAAVLMLHQGLDWTRSLQRGVERMSGTLIGLVLAGAILALHPQGLWIALTLVVLQFIIEMTVVRNYALAVVFITAAALTIAAGGHPIVDVVHLLWVRGVDTFIGCVTGLAVLAIMTPRTVAVRIPQELVNTLAALTTTVGLAATGEVTTGAARRARRDLQHQTIALLQTYDAGVGATLWHREGAERSWPAVVATQRLAYRVLAGCWTLEDAGFEAAPGIAHTLFGGDSAGDVKQALALLANAIQTETRPEPLPQLPEFLRTELANLHDSLVYDTDDDRRRRKP